MKRVGLARSARAMASVLGSEGHGGNLRTPRIQSAPERRAAAQATGAITALTSVSATRMRNGGRNGVGPTMTEAAALTPKISTGMVNGSTSAATSRPPRPSAAVSAAPMAPMSVSAGVPASSVAVVAPGAKTFRQHGQFERLPGKDQQIERAVVAIVAEQAVNVEQRRQQCADPQHRRADARQQLEVGADAERNDGDNRQEKHDADERAAAPP